MSNQQPPPSRPWLRLATMIRPPPPPAPTPAPTAPSNQRPSPPRPAIIRPVFAPIPPPQQPSPTPPPQPPSPSPPQPQQPNVTPSPPRTTPPPVPAINVVEKQASPTPSPTTLAPPTSPSRKSPRSSPPNTPPRPSLTATTSSITTTRATTPPSSPSKIIKPLDPPPLPPTNMVTLPASPPPSPPSRSPPKKSPHPIPPGSPLMQQTEHLLPPSSPSKTISTAPSTMYPISPLVLPSLKKKPYDEGPPEYKQKTADIQETKEIHKSSATGFNGRHTGGVHTHNSIRKPETLKKHWDSEDAGKNIITIAGENKGAIMKITPFSDKQHDFGNNIQHNRHKPTSSNNGETESVAKNKNQKSNELLKTSFLNSNVQVVHNSILLNCSINHHDPGIHLILSTKSDRDPGIHSKEHKNG